MVCLSYFVQVLAYPSVESDFVTLMSEICRNLQQADWQEVLVILALVWYWEVRFNQEVFCHDGK